MIPPIGQVVYSATRSISATRVTQYRIGQEGHQLFSFKQRKVALSPFDDKRYIQEDGVCSLASLWAQTHFKKRHVTDLDLIIQAMDEVENPT